MKIINQVLIGSLLSFTLIGCGSSNDDQTTDNYHFPTSVDSAEAGNGDNSEDNASPIQLNTSYQKTNFPIGDNDWASVDLIEGTEYELTANALCPTCDTEMFLYEKVDGEYQYIDDNDDRNQGYDSGLTFTPERTDTYYIHVKALDDNGVTSYTLNVHEFIDNDTDEFSTFFDCNDNDASIYPFANEVMEDDIDQDCDGSDLSAVATEDRFENDDTFDKANPILFLEHYYTESVQFFQQFKDEMHTIHDMNDVDWLKVTMPANSAAEVYFYSEIEDYDFSVTYFESDGVTPAFYTPEGSEEQTLINDESFVNTLDTEKTYLIKVTSGDDDSGHYMPMVEFHGFDLDKDGFYSMDWSWDSKRDCDDTSADINPGADDIANDGIDQDCDGDDDNQNNSNGPF